MFSGELIPRQVVDISNKVTLVENGWMELLRTTTALPGATRRCPPKQARIALEQSEKRSGVALFGPSGVHFLPARYKPRRGCGQVTSFPRVIHRSSSSENGSRIVKARSSSARSRHQQNGLHVWRSSLGLWPGPIRSSQLSVYAHVCIHVNLLQSQEI